VRERKGGREGGKEGGEMGEGGERLRAACGRIGMTVGGRREGGREEGKRSRIK
jgi:hypothetical protein